MKLPLQPVSPSTVQDMVVQGQLYLVHSSLLGMHIPACLYCVTHGHQILHRLMCHCVTLLFQWRHCCPQDTFSSVTFWYRILYLTTCLQLCLHSPIVSSPSVVILRGNTHSAHGVHSKCSDPKNKTAYMQLCTWVCTHVSNDWRI